MTYQFNTVVPGTFAEAVEKVRAALLEEHLGIVSEVDVQGILKAKLDKETLPYRIFGACNPKMAYDMLSADPNIGTLLPCTFVMYEKDNGEVVVSFMDPVTVLSMAENPIANEIAQIAEERLERVLAKVRV